MCMSSPKPQTIVTDPLSNQKQQAANLALGQYSRNIPFANQFMDRFMPNLGNFDINQSGFPDILKQANTAQQNLLGVATGSTGNTGPFADLKKNLLGEYDEGVQKYTLDPLKEQLIQQGLYSSGPGRDSYANAANQAARGRATLGSEQDVNALNFEQNAISNSSNLGQSIFNMLQTLGFSDPLQAFQASTSINQPSFQDVATTQYTPQNNLGALGSSVLGPMLASLFQSGGGGGASPISGAMSSLGGMGQGLMGMLGQGGTGPNTGLNYNPGGEVYPGVPTARGAAGPEGMDWMKLLETLGPMALMML